MRVEQLKAAIWEWLDSLYLVNTIIWLNPNAPRPTGNYMSLNITNINSVGQDYLSMPGIDGFGYIQGNRVFTLEIAYYRDNRRFDILEFIEQSLYIPSVRDNLSLNGLFYVDTQFKSDVTTLLDTKFEPRAILELRMRYATNDINDLTKYNLGLIESVETSETLN